jgi:hypothetical protein
MTTNIEVARRNAIAAVYAKEGHRGLQKMRKDTIEFGRAEGRMATARKIISYINDFESSIQTVTATDTHA